MIIDGIDYFKDHQTKRDAITAYWMPRELHKRVRLIVTDYGTNNASEYFEKYPC